MVDTYSARQVAELAGTSAARVLRAADAVDYGGGTGIGDVLAADRPRQRSLAGIRDTDVRALAALAHAPLGLSSVRAVARAAGLSPGQRRPPPAACATAPWRQPNGMSSPRARRASAYC